MQLEFSTTATTTEAATITLIINSPNRETMPGSMTASQEETQRFRITQMPEPEDLIQELVSNAKASLKDTHQVLPNQRMEVLMLGLMTVLLIE